MGVIDGTPVDAPTTNPAFLDANQDDTGIGKITLANVDATVSGGQIDNLQAEHNSISNFSGKASNSGITSVPTYTENQGFTPNNNLQARSSQLSAKFHKVTGHSHRVGVDGDGSPVSSVDITDSPNRGFAQAGANLIGVTGISTNVSTQLLAQSPSNGPAIQGVVVNAPYNKIILRQATGINAGDKYTDSLGNEVYGRLTELTGVWTLAYFVDLSTVETPYSFGVASDVAWYYQILTQVLDASAPVYNELFFVPSENATADVVDASAVQRGLVNTIAQAFAGDKTLTAALILQGQLVGDIATDAATTGSSAALPAPSKIILKVSNAGLVSIATITGAVNNRFFVLVNTLSTSIDLIDGVGPDAIFTGTGLDLTMAPGSAIQLFRDNPLGYWRIVGGSGSANILFAAVGSVPNANGGSAVGTTITLQPADATNPGLLTILAQAIAGVKSFVDYIIRGTSSAITAFAGGGQASATQITKDINRISVCATNGDSVKLPVSLAGMEIFIANDGAANCNIFPETGEAIDGLAVNASYELKTIAKNVKFICVQAGSWKSQAGGGGGSILTFGSTSAPRSVVLATGVTAAAGHMSNADTEQHIFVEGSAANLINLVTANPQIQAHTVVGAKLYIYGQNSTQPLAFSNGTGLELNGQWTGNAESSLVLAWTGVAYRELSRKD